MGKFILKRVLITIPMLLLLSFLVFGALELTPTDPVSYMVSPDMASNVDMDAMREALGLNRPFLVRYVSWLGDLFRGDFGYSLVQGVAISKLIARYLPASFELSIVVFILSTILAIALGFLAAVKQNTRVDYACSVAGMVGISIPQFFLGMLLILLFALRLNWLPIGGRSADTFGGRIANMVLPVATMTIPMTAALMRYTRNSMLDVMNSDFIKMARSKGIPEWKVYLKHGFRNAMRPVLVVLVFRISMLFSGSVVIESVFSWPGIGSKMTSAVVSGDYTVIMILALTIAASVLVASFLLDLISAWLDPRVRLGL